MTINGLRALGACLVIGVLLYALAGVFVFWVIS